MPHSGTTGQFFRCVNNEAYPAALELHKVYQSRPDAVAESRGFIRVFDGLGEDFEVTT